MPKLNSATVTAAPRARKIKQHVSAIIRPTSDLLRELGCGIIVPSAETIEQHGTPAYTVLPSGRVVHHGLYDTANVARAIDALSAPVAPRNLTTAVYMQHDNGDCVPLFTDARTTELHTVIRDMQSTMPTHDNAPAVTGTALVPYVAPAIADAAPATSGLSERALARKACRIGCGEFYTPASGNLYPFKPAVDLKYRAAINFGRFVPGSISGTERTAAAIATILAYCDIMPNGEFVRGSALMPRRFVEPNCSDDATLATGPESGVLSRLIGTGAISYVSGATSGAGAELATYRVNYAKARANMLSHNAKLPSGEHAFSRPLALLDLSVTTRD